MCFDLMKQHQWPWFSDVKLGVEGSPDGYAVLRRFGQEQPEVLIVLMTGHGSAAGALDAISFGAYDYLMKRLASARFRPSHVRSAMLSRSAPTMRFRRRSSTLHFRH